MLLIIIIMRVNRSQSHIEMSKRGTKHLSAHAIACWHLTMPFRSGSVPKCQDTHIHVHTQAAWIHPFKPGLAGWQHYVGKTQTCTGDDLRCVAIASTAVEGYSEKERQRARGGWREDGMTPAGRVKHEEGVAARDVKEVETAEGDLHGLRHQRERSCSGRDSECVFRHLCGLR